MEIKARGQQGHQGFTGFQGFTGMTGLTGHLGHQGVQGSVGVQGFQGFTGFQGYGGPQGWDGPKGDIGQQGFTGLQGLKGNKGEKGSQGFTGFRGHQGQQGFTGYQGIVGGVEMKISLESDNYIWNENTNNTYPDIELIRGFTYYINIDVGDNHPVRIQNEDSLSGELYGDGLSHSDNTFGTNAAENKTSGVWTWKIAFNAPDILYYRCKNHSDMKGRFIIVNGKGSQGYTGYQGFTGYGAQGFTGYQTLGEQGFTGFRDLLVMVLRIYRISRSYQGFTGFQGSDGKDGNFGGATFEYKMKSGTTEEDPGDGKIVFNNSDSTLSINFTWIVLLM